MANELRAAFSELLLNRIRQDAYPSNTHMDIFESIATPRQMGQYIGHLMERLEADSQPSISLMRRIQKIMKRYGL